MPHHPTSPLWLYDGNCGVCATMAATLRDRLKPPVEVASHQSMDLAALGVDEEAVSEGPVLWMPEGTYFVGPEAMATLLTLTHQPFATVGRAMLTPGVRHGLRWVGPRVYRARHHLPGTDDSCSAATAA